MSILGTTYPHRTLCRIEKWVFLPRHVRIDDSHDDLLHLIGCAYLAVPYRYCEEWYSFTPSNAAQPSFKAVNRDEIQYVTVITTLECALLFKANVRLKQYLILW